MIINLTETDEFQDLTDIEVKEEMLANISEDTMIDDILDQISFLGTDDNFCRNNSLFNYFRVRIDYLRSKYPDDQDTIIKTNEVLDRIFDAIKKKFALDIKLHESIPFETKLDYVEAAYNFFILHIFEKTSNFFYSYIFDNLDVLRKEGKARLTPEDLKNLSYKTIAESIPAENVPVVYFLHDFLSSINMIDSIQAFEYMIKGEEDEIDNHLMYSLLVNETYADVTFLEPLGDIIQKLAKSNPSEGIDKNAIISDLVKVTEPTSI